jgi:penicillin amidase
MKELKSASALARMDRATNVTEFEAAVAEFSGSINFLYADRAGNIGYWQTGINPVRASGFDPRLPLPGDGSAEWTGESYTNPKSINPTRGWLANWNNKPTADSINADSYQGTLGKLHRYRELEARLSVDGKVSESDMKDIAKDITRIKFGAIGDPKNYVGRESRFMKPYLLSALDAVPPTHPLAAQARAILQAWDGSMVADAVSSTGTEPGEVMFTSWYARMVAAVFNDEFGPTVVATWVGPSTLQHVLDYALTGSSGVPPSRDYFNGADPNVVMSGVFDATLTALASQFGNDPSTWSAPRPTITFASSIVGPIATIPGANRASYGTFVDLGNDMRSQNNLGLGESAFIARKQPSGFTLDPHFTDQLPLYRNFSYKPMHFYQNTQLKE